MTQRIIEVIEFDKMWAPRFDLEKCSLQQSLGANAVNIEHIGSTSVPGLAAKPILDILIEVLSLRELDDQSNQLTMLGYEVKGENGIQGRRYFQKGGYQRSHHIHAFEQGDFNLFRHRAFKEYLIAHPSIAEEYAEIKKQAAIFCNNDNELYIAQKNRFIIKHEKLAILWKKAN